jgi:digeranylgeranylglycerophospholipid reductase
MKNQYDVIVVGAGPGGSIAAKTAAKNGLDVLLIEKRQEIGDPVRCAEGIGKKGLKHHIEPDPKWICADVKGSRIYSPDETVVEMSEELSGGEVGYVLERKIFDRELVNQAASYGVDVMVKTRATGLINENGYVRGIKAMYLGEEYNFYSNIVIGADGVESKIGRWGGIDTSLKPSDIEVCAQYLIGNIDTDLNFCHFYLGNEIAPSGYIWVFPKGKKLANVGIGILGSRSGKNRAIDLLSDFVKQKFPDGKILELDVGGVPVSGTIDQTITNGLMLVGDAARQSDPITGGGLVNAMDAGEIAGNVAYEAISTSDVSTKMLQRYESRWRKTIGQDIDNDLVVKNKFVEFTDEQLNTFAHSLQNVNFNTMNLKELLYVLFKANKRLLWDMRVLFKEYTKYNKKSQWESEIKS